MSIEAMKAALEALEDIFGKNKVDVGAINVLRKAIEEAEKQEPVACPYCHCSATLGAVYFDQNCAGCVKRMIHPQPKREWVGLTDEEAAECWNSSAVTTWKNIEAKLREKNGC
jgi:predicted short-subunit dehydrogenase-like oxidoreductase (DUF2520 family)